jgi:hypothetical protein
MISSTVFLLMESIQCSADLHTGLGAAADRGCIKGRIRQCVNSAGASPGRPVAKVRMIQPS